MKKGDKVRYGGSNYVVEDVSDKDNTVQLVNTLHRTWVSQDQVELLGNRKDNSYEYLVREYKPDGSSVIVASFSTEDEMTGFLDSSMSNGRVFRGETVFLKNKSMKTYRVIHDIVAGLLFLSIASVLYYLCWVVWDSRNSPIWENITVLGLVPFSTSILLAIGFRAMQRERDQTIQDFIDGTLSVKAQLKQFWKTFLSEVQTKQFWFIQLLNIFLAIKRLIKQVALWVSVYLAIGMISKIIREEGGRIEILEALLSLFELWAIAMPIFWICQFSYKYAFSGEKKLSSFVSRISWSIINLFVYGMFHIFEISTYEKVLRSDGAEPINNVDNLVIYVLLILCLLITIEVGHRLFMRNVEKKCNILFVVSEYKRTNEMPEIDGVWGRFIRIDEIKEKLHENPIFRTYRWEDAELTVDFSLRYSFSKWSVLECKPILSKYDE